MNISVNGSIKVDGPSKSGAFISLTRNNMYTFSRDKGPICIECTETDENGNALYNCNEHAKCHINEGSLTCSCKKGWTDTAYGPGSCTDYDECANGLQAISAFARGQGKKSQRLENGADPSGVMSKLVLCPSGVMPKQVKLYQSPHVG